MQPFAQASGAVPDTRGACGVDLTRRRLVSRQQGPLSRPGHVSLRTYSHRMGARRLVRVDAVIERPPAPPWIGSLPFPERVEFGPGTLLDWRWVDKPARLWVGLVRYQRDGLTYEHAVIGELLTVEPDSAGDAGQPEREHSPEGIDEGIP
jgi:hypothetical protein